MQENETVFPDNIYRPFSSGAIKSFPGQLPHFLVYYLFKAHFSGISDQYA